MNKVKKVLTGIVLAFAELVSKVYASDIISLYAVEDPGRYEYEYEKAQTIGDTISKIGKIAIPIVLFIIGLFVLLSKKITKKIKVIVISVLVILAILGYVLMNYIATNL